MTSSLKVGTFHCGLRGHVLRPVVVIFTTRPQSSGEIHYQLPVMAIFFNIGNQWNKIAQMFFFPPASTPKTSTLRPEIFPALSGQLAASLHCSLTALKGLWHFDKTFWVYLHNHVSCWVLWRPALLVGVLCLPSRQFHCYLGLARLTQESYKWALRKVIAHVWPYTTFILMNNAWENIKLFFLAGSIQSSYTSIFLYCQRCCCFFATHKKLKLFCHQQSVLFPLLFANSR